MRFALVAVVWMALGACSDKPGELVVFGANGSPTGDGGPGLGADADGGPTVNPNYTPGAATGCDKMDILFVIDNSGSMGEEQENLAANFPRFVEVLDSFRGGTLQYRLGVTTTAFGDVEFLGGFLASSGGDGELLRTADMDNPWLDRGTPNLQATFTELATVGLAGSANEQPLKAAKYALADRIADGTNAGFLRPDALLALVFLTDEDDSSTEEGASAGGLEAFLGGFVLPDAPVSEFVAAYDDIAMGRERWAASVLAGDQDPDCESDFGSAEYAERLIEFVDLAGSQATFGSICEGDLSAQLDASLNTFSAACDTFVPLI